MYCVGPPFSNRLRFEMPLPSSPANRTRLHTRRLTFDCFQRSDRLFDIECHLSDVKDHDFALLTGKRSAGDPVHDMWARVTIDRDMMIVDIDVSFDAMPYPGACDQIRTAYRKLIGQSLLRGFRQRLHEAMGGVHGCTHVTEMLAVAPTPAIQMFAGLSREVEAGSAKPFQLDRCHTLETTTDTVSRYYPQWYRGVA